MNRTSRGRYPVRRRLGVPGLMRHPPDRLYPAAEKVQGGFRDIVRGMNSRGPAADTSLGGGKRDFPSTCWSKLLHSAGDDPERRRASAELLVRSYWRPIYVYIRSRWAKTNEDAKDLTQDFFLWMME